MKANISSRLPALPVAIGWMAGILLWTAGAHWWLAAAAAGCAAALSIARRHYTALAGYAAAAGWSVAALAAPATPPHEIFNGDERTYIGVVEHIATHTAAQTLTIRIDSLSNNSGRLSRCNSFKISASALPQWSAFVGERIRFEAVVEPLDPGGCFPFDPDMRLNYLRRGVVAQAFLYDETTASIGAENSPAAFFDRRRRAIIGLLAKSGLSETAYSLAAAITVGYADDLDPTLRQNFRAAGIAHTLALSGMHVGIIALLAAFALLPMRAAYALRRMRLAATIALIWLYAAIVGFQPSVVRAVIMLTIILTAKILGREANTLNSLCAAIVIILAVSPFTLFSTGFLLSVSAVIGIIAFAAPLNPFGRQKPHTLRRIGDLAAMPFAAIAGTMVVTTAVFHRLPLLFALSNIVMTIMLPPLMLGSLALTAALAAGFDPTWLTAIVNALAAFAEHCAQFFAQMPFAEIHAIYLSDAQLAALAIAIAAIAVIANFTRRHIATAAALLLAAALAAVILIDEKPPQTETFIIAEHSNTPIVHRQADTLHVVFTCHPRHAENARRHFVRRIAPYVEARRISHIAIHTADFAVPGFSRRGDILDIRGRRVALAAAPGPLSPSDRPVDYALVCSRFRGTIADVESAFRPDTIVLSRDISPRRTRRYLTQASRPIIDLHP